MKKGKVKRFLRSLQADQARLMNAYAELRHKHSELAKTVESQGWRIDECTPRFPEPAPGQLMDYLKKAGK